MHRGLDPRRLGRAVLIAAVVASVYASPEASGVDRHTSAPAAAMAAGFTPSLAEPMPYRRVSKWMPAPGTPGSSPWVRASLAFVVTVCFDDVEYSIACRESGLLEAARRLEQIFIDNYTTRIAAGSLKVVFWVAVESQAQLRFLGEVEDRATAAATARLQSEHPSQFQQLRAWQDAANQEARSGQNWLHDWPGRTHQYQVGPSRRQLVQINGG
jgi:hypothetical protein